MPELSLASMKRLLRKSGNERVSRDASLELQAVLESLGEEVSKEAIRKASKKA